MQKFMGKKLQQEVSPAKQMGFQIPIITRQVQVSLFLRPMNPTTKTF